MEAECHKAAGLPEREGALQHEMHLPRSQEIEENGGCSGGTSDGMLQSDDQEGRDERLAAVLQLQLVQQKQEMMAIEEAHAVTKADALFRKGLEQLIGEHLKTCMGDPFGSGGGSSPCLEGFVCTAEGGIESVQGAGSSRSGESGHVEASESGELEQQDGELEEEETLLTRRRSGQAPEIDTLSRDAELVALARMQAVSTMLGASFLQEEPAASSSRHLEFAPYMQRAHLEALERWRNLEIQRHIEMEEQSRQSPRGVVRRRPDSGLASERRNDSTKSESSSGLTAETNSESRTERESIEVESCQQEESTLQETAGASSSAESSPTSFSQDSRQEQADSQPLDAGTSEPGRNSLETDPCQQETSSLSVIEMVRQQESARAHAEEGAQRERQMLRRRAQQRDRFLELEAAWERERERELAGLGQQRAVSEFAHRTRLQSLFRGHFLRQNPGEESNAAVTSTPPARAEDMNFLRERRPVSGIRELFRHNLENIVRRQAAGEAQNRASRVNAGLVSNRGLAGNQGLASNQGLGNAPQAGVESSNREESMREQSGAQAQQASQVRWVDEANEYNMELQELLARRSVSTTLTSTFRHRLETLIESFVLSRVGNHAQRPPNATVQVQAASRPPVPPPMPQAPLWQPPQMAAAAPPARWNTGGNGVHDLRESMRLLQQEMEQMRGLMQNCFEMQMELQRSIRQEVAGALQRGPAENCHLADMHMDGSKWAAIKRGVCCVCCESPIDSLMYRCGHMCACHRCARQLQQTTETCPMCRAPIIEVVRAFTTA